MEKLNVFIANHAKSMKPFDDSIALKNFDFNTALQNIQTRIGDISERFPATMQMLDRGLRLR